MAKLSFAPEETLLADLSPQRSTMAYPVLELILITGVIWLGIGALDAYISTAAGNELPVLRWLRISLLVAWIVFAWRRCIRHLLFRHRSRMMLTNQRLITASGHLRSQIAEVPLAHIVDARNRGSQVWIYTMGARVPLVMHNVPKAKKFVRLLRQYLRPL